MLNVTSASANSAFILSEVAYGRWFSLLAVISKYVMIIVA